MKAGRLRATGGLELVTDDLDLALTTLDEARRDGRTVAVGLVANAADVFAEMARRGLVPDIVTDQTAAHDARYGYLPQGYDLAAWRELREAEPERVERDARASIATQVQAARHQGKLEAATDNARETGKSQVGQVDVATVKQLVCPQCGCEARGGKFCPDCGHKLGAPSQCGGCQAELPAGSRFCPECGTPTGSNLRNTG